MKAFLCEEQGQSTMEYLMMVGSIMVAAVVALSIYYKLGEANFKKIEATTDDATTVMSSKIIATVDDIG